ncbi:MAG TPA: WYL domain-containing protein [Victivallales bacterium]|nr:WYL domain-containing protein [Victivallales bacterium]
MSLGFSKSVLERTGELFRQIQSGKTRSAIIGSLYQGDKRLLSLDLAKLRQAGIRIPYLRSTNTYQVSNWPKGKTFHFRFDQDEFFYVFMILSQFGDKIFDEKLSLALSDESDAIFDVGPAYGISQNITGDIAGKLATIKDAINDRRKLVLRYHSLSSGVGNRIVDPYKLIHTPISWYLLAYCESMKDYWKFKLARISEITILKGKFQRRKDFDLEKIIGDAWWIRNDPKRKPYSVKVLFKNETSQSIREYKFHKSQKLESVPDGTLASWRLSSLDEFACWLLQWLGNIKIIEPEELREIIDIKIEKYKKSSLKSSV